MKNIDPILPIEKTATILTVMRKDKAAKPVVAVQMQLKLTTDK